MINRDRLLWGLACYEHHDPMSHQLYQYYVILREHEPCTAAALTLFSLVLSSTMGVFNTALQFAGLQKPTPQVRISALWVYPIKGCRGVQITTGVVETIGFPLDRYWMIVTETEGRFVTQRQEPKLALIATQLPHEFWLKGSQGHFEADAALSLNAPNMPTIHVPFRSTTEPNWLNVRCHDWKGLALDQGQAVADWLSTFLGQQVRLVKYGGQPGPEGLDEDSHRRSSAKGWYSKGQSETAFSDAFPFLVTSQASMDDLNTHLDEPVPMDRFRPNIVLEGNQEPWAEDQWAGKNLCIQSQQGSSTELEMCKPCSRCTVPLVDQATAEKSSQPILAMKDFRLGKHLGFDKFRSYADKPIYRGGAVNSTTFFGWDAVPLQIGAFISVGDKVVLK